MRDKVIITGAGGGMGRACARLFGNAHDLVLTDRPSPALDNIARELNEDGCTVDVHAGDITDAKLTSALMDRIGEGERFTLIHAAGVGPSQLDWRTIIEINLIAAEQLVRAGGAKASPGSVAILIASTAGYMMPAIAEIDTLLEDASAPDFVSGLVPYVAQMSGSVSEGAIAYLISKYGVQKLAERHAATWGRKGARIVSISPGLIMTPMSRREMAQSPDAAAHGKAAAVGRFGTPMDIAHVAQFLASDMAAYISGCDIRVDGGSIAVERNRASQSAD